MLRFWIGCGEDDVKIPISTEHMDPVMLTYNENVSDGKANGSRASLKRVVLKPGKDKSVVKLSNSILVDAFFAGQVSHFEMRHCNTRVFERRY